MSDEARMGEPRPPRKQPRPGSDEAAGPDPDDHDHDHEDEAAKAAQPFQIPGADILEPHESLKYVGKLFKGLAVAVFLLMAAEIVLGITQDGLSALPLLILEVAQLLIFGGLMWGFGDLAYLVVETNHDVRASRVHLWQLNMMRQMELRDGGVHVEPIDTEEDFA